MIDERFGTARGLVRLALSYAEVATRQAAILPHHPDAVTRLVFVCHGNICRSAFAHAVAERLGANVASFGLSTASGKTWLIWLITAGALSLAGAAVIARLINRPLKQLSYAANKVKDLIIEEGNPDLKLRVFVTGGGCSGFQYGFTFDEIRNDDDTVMEKDGVMLLIDPMSYQYLVGAEIDYTEGLEGSQFVIRNPNATSTCGCGSSFSA